MNTDIVTLRTVPDDKTTRDKIRLAAVEWIKTFETITPPAQNELKKEAIKLLKKIKLPDLYTGFTMVEICNSFWEKEFAAVPYSKRILLLPHCLKNEHHCKAAIQQDQLICNKCNSCNISQLKTDAEALGYKVIIAEGSPTVVRLVLQGGFDAILGVACLESLEKAFEKISLIGIPYSAVPLLNAGCKSTKYEEERLNCILKSFNPRAQRIRTYLPLLRFAHDIFEPKRLTNLLKNELENQSTNTSADHPKNQTEEIAVKWLLEDGKRFRPFITIAAFAVAKYGIKALEPQTKIAEWIPDSILRIAIAVEAMHKASLIHDDIEDNDSERYGQKTLHIQYGIPQAINVGDYLIGLGYSLIASETDALGSSQTADMLRKLSTAHLKLCRGQGAEIAWRDKQDMQPIDSLAIYAAKTAPAFEAALYIGFRAAGTDFNPNLLKDYAKAFGIAYQVQNDLEEWEPDEHGLIQNARDAIAGRATVLHLFALENSTEQDRRILQLPYCGCMKAHEFLKRNSILYEKAGAFKKAKSLIEKYKKKALSLSDEVAGSSESDLLKFLTNVIIKMS